MNTIIQTPNSNPTFIARETLKRLALKKIPPTPDNYFKFYNEIVGVSKRMTAISGELLLELAKEFPCYTPLLRSTANHLEDAAKARDWEKYKSAIISLAISITQSDELPGKLARRKHQETSMSAESSHQEDAQPKTSEQEYAHGYAPRDLLELFAHVFSCIAVSLVNNTPLSQQSQLLSQQVLKIDTKANLEEFVTRFQQFCVLFKSHGKDETELQKDLLRFLHLLIDNTQELLAEDSWVSGQISKIKEIMSKPLDFEIILQAGNYLDEVSRRQKIIKQSLGKAKQTVKQLVNSLIFNIEGLSNSTGAYHDKLQYFTEKVNQVTDLEYLNLLLVEVLDETKAIQSDVVARQKELLIAREEVNRAQEHISQLEIKLLELDRKIHEDHLTGVLNRRGFDDALERELSKSHRNFEPLSLVLLDLDNFKLFNDTYGHNAGDDVLVFLASIVKETIRPSDIIARYGGEEFALLLPNTMNEEAISIAARILRNLTKKFFLYKNNKLLITFSAGVAQYQMDESQGNFLCRADAAMYKAKKNGKNQIISA